MRKLTGILALLILFSGGIKAQSEQDYNFMAKKKAMYVYNFANLVDWPKEFKKGNFVIGVVADQYLYDWLVKSYSSKTIGSQPIKIKKFNSIKEVTGCHVLYLPENKCDSMKELLKKINSTLLVTDKYGLLKQGSVINFIKLKPGEVRPKFELSTVNAKKNNLIVGEKLITLATNVE